MQKILIIKLGADGDVIRTIPLAKAIKDNFPDSEITWITRGDTKDLLENISYISRVLSLPYISSDSYDLLYNFDIEKEALELASSITALKKYGFFEQDDYPAAFNTGAEYYLNTVFDDQLKKENKKTYQEMMFELAELLPTKVRYSLVMTQEDSVYAQEFIEQNSIKENKLIGIHMGAGSRWPSKAWHEAQLENFITKCSKKGHGIILFGGPNEVGKHEKLAKNLLDKGIKIYQNNPSNTKRQFASLVNLCDIMVCSDSFALHVSLGLGKKTNCLFFCTSPNEVEDYGLLTKIVSPKLYEFFPERSDQYDESLVSSISSEQVLEAIEAA